jgi:hypothetical protein
MPWFITAYHADGSLPPALGESWVGAFGGYLFARDFRQAKLFAKRRGLNEAVEGRMGQRVPYVLPSQWLARRRADPTDVFHSLIWMGYLAVKSGAASLNEVFGDEGIVHEYAHMRTTGRPRRKELIERVQAIECRIPGMMPPTKMAQLRRGRQQTMRVLNGKE